MSENDQETESHSIYAVNWLFFHVRVTNVCHLQSIFHMLSLVLDICYLIWFSQEPYEVGSFILFCRSSSRGSERLNYLPKIRQPVSNTTKAQPQSYWYQSPVLSLISELISGVLFVFLYNISVKIYSMHI